MRTIRGVATVVMLFFIMGCQTPQHGSSSQRGVAQVQPESYLKPQSYEYLTQYTPYKYEVLFTNPICGPYKYNTEVLSQRGKKLKQKPQNVYCKNQYDLKRSSENPMSPQYRLIQWINDPKTTEVFFTYLSFSNRAVKNALCEAMTQRNIKVKFVLDSGTDLTRANELIACKPSNVEMKLRGSENGLGYAHNKFFIINPNTPGEFKIVFSSGNMSSGPVIHHENWNFITTNSQSQFAQAHLCAMNAEWSETAGRSRQAYINYIKSCRAQIKAPVEKDIKVFFIPGEGEYESGVTNGEKTAADYMINGDGKFPGIKTASRVWLACHRFFYSKMIGALESRMSYGKRPDLRIIADDDTFYVANDPNFTAEVMASEYSRIQGLVKRGAKSKFMETNSEERQLHHSKYLIFADKTKKFRAVFTGSANLTGAGFNKNWENSYYITIPEVANAFANQYTMMWDKMATNPRDLPKQALVSQYLEGQPQAPTEPVEIEKPDPE